MCLLNIDEGTNNSAQVQSCAVQSYMVQCVQMSVMQGSNFTRAIGVVLKLSYLLFRKQCVS